MIQRQCTTLAAAANSRLLICPPFGVSARRRSNESETFVVFILPSCRTFAQPPGRMKAAAGWHSIATHNFLQKPQQSPRLQGVQRRDSYAQMIRTGGSAMIRKQEKPIGPVPTMSPGEYEAAVAAFIRNRGVTRCPTACLVRTQASVPAADRAALERYEARREHSRRESLAAAELLLGILPAPPNAR
jgi:hypothetical protein